MVTSPYEWTVLEWEENPQTNKHIPPPKNPPNQTKQNNTTRKHEKLWSPHVIILLCNHQSIIKSFGLVFTTNWDERDIMFHTNHTLSYLNTNGCHFRLTLWTLHFRSVWKLISWHTLPISMLHMGDTKFRYGNDILGNVGVAIKLKHHKNV